MQKPNYKFIVKFPAVKAQTIEVVMPNEKRAINKARQIWKSQNPQLTPKITKEENTVYLD